MSYLVARHSQVWRTYLLPADTGDNAIAFLGHLMQAADTDREEAPCLAS